MNSIGVHNEWGKLREVIVGVLPDDVIVPTPTHMAYAYLDRATLALLEKHQGKPLKELAPELVEGTARQLDGLARAYEKAGVKVHRARPLTADELRFGAELALGGAPVYVRDPILVVGHHLIELAVKTPYRRREIFGIRELLERRVAEDPRARYYAMPPPRPVQPTRASDGPGPFLEGGDIFVLDKDILVGNSGLASDRAGIDWLQRALDPEGFTVHEVALTGEWLHLDCIFAVIRPGLAVCHLGGLARGLPPLLKDWEIIPATSAEAHHMGCNTVCLQPNTPLVAEEHTRLIQELEQRQVNVVSGFRMDVVSQWGGGIRCASHPLRRDL
jgi:N-dimethylarginine dimethylaminohydrolase